LTEDTNMQKVVYQCTSEVKLWICRRKALEEFRNIALN